MVTFKALYYVIQHHIRDFEYKTSIQWRYYRIISQSAVGFQESFHIIREYET